MAASEFQGVVNDLIIPLVPESQASFAQEELLRIALKAEALSRQIFRHPELGTEEVRTSDIFSRELAKVLGAENVAVLVKTEIGAPKVENGILVRDFTAVWGSPHIDMRSGGFMEFVEPGVTEMGGVVGVLEGDNPQGQTIAIFSDLDALENGHHCGHNAHTGALLADAMFLKACQEKGIPLDVNKIVFIARVNEEGLNPNRQFSDAQEMLNAGLLELIGAAPDVVLSTHVLPSVPLGEVVVEAGSTTHAVGFISGSITSGEDSLLPAQVVMARITERIAAEWGSEGANIAVPSLGKVGSRGLTRLVRIADSGNSLEKRDGSSRQPSKIVTLNLQPGQDQLVQEALASLEGKMSGWRERGVSIDAKFTGDQIILNLEAESGHIAEQGPNIEYLSAVVVNHLDRSDISWLPKAEEITFAGTIRLKHKQWQSKGEEIARKVEEIIHDEARKARAATSAKSGVVVPPVVNDPRLRAQMLDLISEPALKGHLRPARERLLAAYGEPFSFWQKVLGARGLLTWVGTGSPEEIQANQSSALGSMQLHHQDMVVPIEAVPYLAITGMLALKIAASNSRQ